MTRRPFLIIDQSLKDADGHHYEMDLYVGREAAARGFDVTVAAHADYDTRLPFEGVTLVRHFTQSWIEAKQSPAMRRIREWLELCPPSWRGRLVNVALAIKRSIQPPQPDVAAPLAPFGRECVSLMAERKLDAQSHVFIHTLSGPELRSLIEALPSLGDIPVMHLVLRRDAEDPAMNAGVPGGLEGILRAISANEKLAGQVRLYCDTEALSAQHRAIAHELPVTTLPIPVTPIDEAANAMRAPGPLRLVYLGNARTEKGFHLLPDALDALRKSNVAVEMQIQANSNFSLDEDIILNARKRLAKAGAVLYNEPLDEAAYRQLLLRADIVLLPYNASQYERRSSGVLVQALAAGKPVVVPDRCWLSDEAPASSSVRFSDDASFAAAVAQAVETFETLSAAARADAPLWRRMHNPAALVDCLLRGA